MADKQIEFTIVVNGQPVPVKVFIYDEVRVAVKQALDESNNSGQPLANWELRDASGHVLDTGRKIANSDIKEGAKLFLNLKAGVGGDNA